MEYNTFNILLRRWLKNTDLWYYRIVHMKHIRIMREYRGKDMDSNKDINNMKMWVFRLAQIRWEKTSEQCARIFKDNNLYKIISDGYDYLHLMGYNSVVTELEEILAGRGVNI